MKTFKLGSVLSSGLLCAFLIVGFAAPLVFTSCEGENKETVKPDSGSNGSNSGTNPSSPSSPSLSDIMKDTDKMFIERMTVVDNALKEGKINEQEAKDLIKLAVESVSGTNVQKQSTLGVSLKSKDISLKVKLLIIEVAYEKGILDEKETLEEIKAALGFLKGNDAELDSAVVKVEDSIDDICALVDATGDALDDELSNSLNGLFNNLDNVSSASDIVAAVNTGMETVNTTVCDVDGMFYGHAYVEMGDGLKWSTVNMGATNPEEYGDYYAWAETVSKGNKKENYTWGTYKYMQEGQASHLYVNKYTFDDKFYTTACWYSNGVFVGDNGDGVEHRDLVSYDLEDDAARQNWRSTWRMPTLAEFKWLLDNCIWTWTPDYNGTGVKGYTVTSKVEGFTENSLFFPAAGVLSSVGVEPGLSGRYWSSSSGSHPVYGAVMYFNHGVSGVSDSFGYNVSTTRLTGLPIRPVAD